MQDIKYRITTNVLVDTNGCWIWQRRRDRDGYGTIMLSANGKKSLRSAHRVSYQAFVGAIGDGLQVDHLCRNRACVNPQHLEPVTPKENKRRSNLALGLDAACKNGHERSAENTYWVSPGHPACKICQRAGAKRWLEKQREPVPTP